MTGEPKTLTTQVWAGRVEVLVDKEERVIHKISFELPPGFTFAEPTADGVRDEATELRAALAEVSDLVYIIRHAEEELGNAPLLRDMGVSTAHMRDMQGAIESAWERLCALAALHDDTSVLAATEGSE